MTAALTSLATVALWGCAGVFIAVVIARIVRACLATEDPENPRDY